MGVADIGLVGGQSPDFPGEGDWLPDSPCSRQQCGVGGRACTWGSDGLDLNRLLTHKEC